MPKNIVICCDGTGNQIDNTISNVLKLYRILEKGDRQRVYYSPGIGTIGQQNAWQRFKQKARGVFGLVTGYGLDDDVLGAYRFLSQTYEKGDKVWLFGFSRGAYTVRVLAAFLHVIGLLRPDQLNLAGYALTAFKKSSADSHRASPGKSESDKIGTGNEGLSTELEDAWHFSRVAGGKTIRIEFVGVWDTVASVIIPRKDTFLPDLQTLRFTRTNSSVKTFRHAMAIDERRRMFRLNAWKEGQPYRPVPFIPASEIPQDILQVWFAGVHADVGGGYPESESGLSKYPLLWMIEEAHAKGLLIHRAMVNHLVLGRPRKGSNHTYVEPDAAAKLHVSMTAGWKPLEWLPKKSKWREWKQRRSVLGWYLPCAEPRVIPEGAFIHRTVFERIERLPDYRPVNLPSEYQVAQ
ncbi:T6SS phospholipase effector Tle1-like catalytic domain-containing protein [Dyella agri]|uniref:DUF2235 domain-containing protein n=1 Tax=Dyella agri TaxID=1926869 RepID=A0ABW8KMS3_9GAMM